MPTSWSADPSLRCNNLRRPKLTNRKQGPLDLDLLLP